MTGADFVAGVDGCRGGWLVVRQRLEDPASARAFIAPTFRDVLAIDPVPIVIAVDMPIGLPERTGAGGRAADAAVRALLGRRQSSVFAVPARSAVMQQEYGAACRAALAASDPPRKVAKQTYHLFPKIREVDRLMTPGLQARVVECHPETSFWALNTRRPLDLPKKVKSRPYAPGIEERRSLLEAAGYSAGLFATPPWRAGTAGDDDLVDATVAAWTAARVACGTARRFPEDPPIDGHGLRMEIWA